MSKKVLYFEGAGCDGTQRNDVENCRIRTAFTNNEGNKIYLEMISSEKSMNDKKVNRLSSYNVGDVIGYIDHCHYITNNPEIDDNNNSRLSHERKTNFEYTKQNILDFVNKQLGCSFDEVIILPNLSGYRVHSGSRTNTDKDYNFIENFTYKPEITTERNRIYKQVATEYFDNIYKAHAEVDRNAARLYSPMRNAHSIVSIDDNSITVRSHTYSQLINEDERVKTFEINL